jgi:hypothetical protein
MSRGHRRRSSKPPPATALEPWPPQGSTPATAPKPCHGSPPCTDEPNHAGETAEHRRGCRARAPNRRATPATGTKPLLHDAVVEHRRNRCRMTLVPRVHRSRSRQPRLPKTPPRSSLPIDHHWYTSVRQPSSTPPPHGQAALEPRRRPAPNSLRLSPSDSSLSLGLPSLPSSGSA